MKLVKAALIVIILVLLSNCAISLSNCKPTLAYTSYSSEPTNSKLTTYIFALQPTIKCTY